MISESYAKWMDDVVLINNYMPRLVYNSDGPLYVVTGKFNLLQIMC